MNKRKLLTLAMTLCMVAILAIGGTLAYFTDDAYNENTMVFGGVAIEQLEYQRELNEDGTYKTDTIDNQTSYVLEPFEQDKPMFPIVGDPNEPGNSPAYAGWDDITVRMGQVGSHGGMQVFAGKNAQDKFVVVENTGDSEAYVRTLVAIEVGSGNSKLIMTSSRSGSETAPWVKDSIADVTIDGNTYDVIEYIYRGASDVDRHVNGVLPAGEKTYPSLCQVYLKHNATNEDVEALDGNDNDRMDILVLSQAAQVEGFDDAETALDTAFGEFNAENVKTWFEAK